MAGSAGFPQCGELHPDVVAFVAQAVKADPATLEAYDWAGRTIERHQAEIRAYFGFRVCRDEDGARIAWRAGRRHRATHAAVLSWPGRRSWSHAGSGHCNSPLPATPTGTCARRFSRPGRLLAEQVHARLGAAARVPGQLLAWFTGSAAGSLVAAHGLAGVPGPAIDDAELVFPGA